MNSWEKSVPTFLKKNSSSRINYMNSVDQADVSGKVVLVRADFDVPVKDGQVKDKTRIEKSLKTLKLLRQKQAKLVIISHLGRPEGKDPNLSLKIIQPILEELLGEEIIFQENLDE